MEPIDRNMWVPADTSVRIVNAYEDGYTFSEVVRIGTAPRFFSMIDDWFDEEVHDHIGCGRDPNIKASYEATVIEGPRWLLNYRRVWEG